MASVSWEYPQDQIVALRGQDRDSDLGTPVATGVDRGALNFRYRIEGDEAPWRPLRAFDDGRQVYTPFPPGIGQGGLPPPFLPGADGGPELVHPLGRPNWVHADRPFSAPGMRRGG